MSTHLTDAQNVEVTEWLIAKGYDFDMRDGLWFEAWITEHTWGEVFELMVDWAEHKAAE